MAVGQDDVIFVDVFVGLILDAFVDLLHIFLNGVELSQHDLKELFASLLDLLSLLLILFALVQLAFGVHRTKAPRNR